MTTTPHRSPLPVLTLLLIGCGPTKAPLDIEEMLTYGFVQYDSRFDRSLQELGEN
jgi:hypothetical protein